MTWSGQRHAINYQVQRIRLPLFFTEFGTKSRREGVCVGGGGLLSQAGIAVEDKSGM